jgi:hypothetical protein
MAPVKYLLLICGDDSVERSPRDSAAIDLAAQSWDAEMTRRGVLVEANRLRPVSDATTLRVRDDDVLITDGPFAETKEQIAGYVLIECADLDEAIALVSTHPLAALGAVELRPLWAQ